jgi:archaemetzincin
VSHEIRILNGSWIRSDSLAATLRRIEEIFAAPVSIDRATLDLRAAFDTSRHQTNSTQLLAQILDEPHNPEQKQIGIVDVDLFIPILTFVFGEAQLGGPAAVVSTHRLSNPFYGLARDDARLLQRLEKEMVHELGHAFGLYHCRYFECVMRASTYVEEIDLKRVYPCDACATILARHQLVHSH